MSDVSLHELVHSAAAARATVPGTDHEVLTADEAAALLRCDRKTIYLAVARSRIPHQRLGRKVLFSRAALLDWLACKAAVTGKDS